ncbi:hypothetical protein [Micromonospora sp. KC721]|uniref:DUF7144 family membrane protein n=1 Tax=Micromonospora sp. KC721 TaxID=2530380 RepID=UPI00104FC533|nr:hypothetical protein [Micromonospora sp. KC721]TDB70760.1 hypothetical protein E1182_26635 [Micromonospora sp. KC721]
MGSTAVIDGTGTARPPRLAGGLLVVGGGVDVLSAWAQTVGDPFVAVGEGGVRHLDVTGWAWLNVGVGAAVTLAGLLVLTGRRGALPAAGGCAALAILVGVLLFPYDPIRTLLVVGLDGAAVRLLLRHRRLSATRRSGPSVPGPPPGSPPRSG